VVGDERGELVGALREAAARAQVLVVSGGLGPTADDLTVACAAQAAGLPLAYSADIFQSIEARAQRLGFRLTEAAKKQAWIPQGARYVLNRVGSAPMVHLRMASCEVFLLPGVPREFRAFVEGALLGWLEECLLPSTPPLLPSPSPPAEGRMFRKLRRLQCMGLPESLIDEAMAPIAAAFPAVRVGFRVRFPAVEVKLLCEAGTVEALAQLEGGVVAAARKALGVAVFGEGEEGLGEGLVDLLLERGQTVGVAESCTGGQVAAELTARPGASRCMLGSAVAYTAKAKRLWVGLSEEALGVHGEVSAETTRLLAQGVRERLETDWGLAITGYAGGGRVASPPPPPEEQAGLFFIACMGPRGVLREARVFWPGARKEVQRMAAAQALNLLRLCLLEAGEG